MNQEEHHHHHHKSMNTRQLKRAFIATFFFMFIEFAGGFYTNSLALTSDALHMLTDAAALGLALFAAHISQKKNHEKIEVQVAYVNAVFLILMSIFIIFTSFKRFSQPEEIKSLETMAIAFVGLIFNIFVLFQLSKAHSENINIRSATLHVFGDLIATIGVIISSVLAYWFGFQKADSIASILISILIIFSTTWIFKSSRGKSV
jgi:cobalt-zinc-cadmium efflux system protein